MFIKEGLIYFTEKSVKDLEIWNTISWHLFASFFAKYFSFCLFVCWCLKRFIWCFTFLQIWTMYLAYCIYFWMPIFEYLICNTVLFIRIRLYFIAKQLCNEYLRVTTEGSPIPVIPIMVSPIVVAKMTGLECISGIEVG